MAGGIRDSGDDDDLAESHDINVTPFIDVMLVLLIIFMVAAPLSTVGVPVNLPRSNAAPAEPIDDPVYITLQPDLTVSLGEDPVARDQLGPRVMAATGGDVEKRLFLRADATVPYGELMQVMNLLRRAGFTKVALIGLEASQ
ncbi:outer membrane transport energization protein ExbD [Gemmobacter megaterium]|uniref:Biopolymer transport protein ExbD n=1 Tax=Gemmobacter megaterium TaxID=1086013 RepID=A0A1N7KYV1_9RHOB|nr:TonB system transport protein ExbD [Gemmobacter megaterium]GGE04609.1 TonB system transport protein ExbD [Gemmobacter megaterium]SIS66763.1 outer membrane transport energization protein ExbD [Gemmobacter megaterium]